MRTASAGDRTLRANSLALAHVHELVKSASDTGVAPSPQVPVVTQSDLGRRLRQRSVRCKGEYVRFTAELVRADFVYVGAPQRVSVTGLECLVLENRRGEPAMLAKDSYVRETISERGPELIGGELMVVVRIAAQIDPTVG